MIYFSIPSDFKISTVDQLYEINNSYEGKKVAETYGQITINNVFSSGRSADCLPKVDKTEFEKYIAYLNQKGLSFNYTFNATCNSNMEFSQKGIRDIKNFFLYLYELGIHSVTVASPAIIEIVESLKYKFEVKTSTACQITDVNKAMSFKKMGVSKIVVDEGINRDFYTIKNIRRAFGEKVEIIVNTLCHKNCIYRMFHYNQVAHDNCSDLAGSTYYNHRCIMKRAEAGANVLKLNWIRPEDLHLYQNIGIQYFKIQGRQAVEKGDIIKTVMCYMNESFDGNLIELLYCFSNINAFNTEIDNKKLNNFIRPFFMSRNFCKNDCTKCNYCNRFFKKCCDMEQFENVNSMIRKFYNNYDQFKNALKE